ARKLRTIRLEGVRQDEVRAGGDVVLVDLPHEVGAIKGRELGRPVPATLAQQRAHRAVSEQRGASHGFEEGVREGAGRLVGWNHASPSCVLAQSRRMKISARPAVIKMAGHQKSNSRQPNQRSISKPLNRTRKPTAISAMPT